MADLYSSTYKTAAGFSAEMGNAWTADFEADMAAASADVIYVGVIPAGVRVTQVRIISEDTGSTSTIDVGYAPEDGTTPTAAPNYWWNDLDTSGAAVAGFSSAYPVQFDKPVRVRILVNSADFTGTPRISLQFFGEMVGAK
jgi:hypothetical protein